MALVKAQKALIVLAEDTANSTVDKLAAFLSERITFDEDMTEMFNEFKNLLKDEYKTTAKTAAGAAKAAAPKKTRAPTAYNLFAKELMPELKKKYPALPGKELMTYVAAEWNKKKNATQTPDEDDE